MSQVTLTTYKHIIKECEKNKLSISQSEHFHCVCSIIHDNQKQFANFLSYKYCYFCENNKSVGKEVK